MRLGTGAMGDLYQSTYQSVAGYGAGAGLVNWGPDGQTTTGLKADLAAAEAPTLNALRQAALYQQILELDARGGTRYVESIYSRFGVISPDFRLQRPELS